MGSSGSRTTAEDVSKGIDMKGKNVIVTGGNTGIGFETCRVLMNLGAHVYLAARSQEKGEGAVRKLKEGRGEGEKEGDVEWLRLDLNSLESVRGCAEEFLGKEVPLHVLINNAGIMMIPENTPTTDGFESQMGVNHIGHFYLTRLLVPALQRGREESGEVVRVVNLASTAHQSCGLVWDNLLSEKQYHPIAAYGQSKTANICFAIGLHERYHKEGIHSYSVHPGVINTELGRNSNLASFFYTFGQVFMKSIPQGAATTVYCATSPAVLSEVKNDPKKASDGSGRYYADCGLAVPKDYCNVENANRLWEWTEEQITGKGFSMEAKTLNEKPKKINK